jgi:hypothetical protein
VLSLSEPLVELSLAEPLVELSLSKAAPDSVPPEVDPAVAESLSVVPGSVPVTSVASA